MRRLRSRCQPRLENLDGRFLLASFGLSPAISCPITIAITIPTPCSDPGTDDSTIDSTDDVSLNSDSSGLGWQSNSLVKVYSNSAAGSSPPVSA